MFANTKAFSGFAVDDLEAAKPVRGILRRRSHPHHVAPAEAQGPCVTGPSEYHLPQRSHYRTRPPASSRACLPSSRLNVP